MPPRVRLLALGGFTVVGIGLVAFTLLGSHLLSAAHTSSDEAAYLQYAHNLLHGGYAVAGQQREGLYLWHSPAVALLITPLVWLKLPISLIRLTGPIFILAAGLTLTSIMRRFVSSWIAVCAGLALCLYPPFWRLLPELFAEPLALLTCLLGFLALLKARERRRAGWAIAAGVAFGCMTLAREEYGYLLLGCLAVSVVALGLRRARPAARPLAVASLAALIVCAPWLAYTYSKTHVPFYWSAASGESLYWMSSTSPGETGSWLSARAVFTDPHLASHRALFTRVDRMSQLQGNRTLTRIAENSIQRNPGNYLHHVLQNGERIFLGVPFSFQGGAATNLAFYGLPNVALLLVAVLAVVIMRRRRARLPALLIPTVAFGLIGLAMHLPVSAYPRMATLSIPAFLVVAALGLEAWRRSPSGPEPAPEATVGSFGPVAAPALTPLLPSGQAATLTAPDTAVELDADDDVLDRPDASRNLVRGSAGRTAAYVLASLANAAVLPFLFRYLGVVRSASTSRWSRCRRSSPASSRPG